MVIKRVTHTWQTVANTHTYLLLFMMKSRYVLMINLHFLLYTAFTCRQPLSRNGGGREGGREGETHYFFFGSVASSVHCSYWLV